MQTPTEIEFRDIEETEHIRSAIAEHVADLESRFGRLTACRVLVKSPGSHHHTGGVYQVNIHLLLPDGREVAVGRTAAGDERLANLTFAVNHAFKRARRRLQDQVRRMQGLVKTHAERPNDTMTP